MERSSPPPSDLQERSQGTYLSSQLRDWHKSLTVTALAGLSNMCGAFVTNPVNVVKVRMQLDGALPSSSECVYGGFVSGILRVRRDEGFTSLWRGTGAALLREASYSSIRMGLYEPFKMMLGGDDQAHTPLWIKITAGASAGVIGSAVANPTDVVMVRMQAQRPAQVPFKGAHAGWNYGGPFQAFSSIARTEGLRGLYRGLLPTMQRAALLNAAQAPSYDHAKHAILNAGIVGEGVTCHMIASMVAGLMSAIVISPVDLIRTRIMQQAVDAKGHGMLYSSTFDCFWKTLRSEGPHGLYKGFVPVWLRIGPHTIVTFFIFEQLRKRLGIMPI
ncbi:hypothetical protein GOP47_0026044 [Adiantum capillus-veneris]|uniref:Uncharacterized protein n=1 Tax=Adiantum capillus-veneris TaxID=13818 RepID=A0A9D4Z3E2_ADICA|nr:hypothetical protein GOP47_0025538 [Adiantum capillus-veneris]KAI5059725.1 hypothetical protein GOP47_0026044 [Adiantum capillus-veneris]